MRLAEVMKENEELRATYERLERENKELRNLQESQMRLEDGEQDLDSNTCLLYRVSDMRKEFEELCSVDEKQTKRKRKRK